MNDMLKDVVKEGTAKKLSFCNQALYGKTGTVGTKNGNTDAYSISYNSEYILGVWFGNKDNKLLPNSITGGGEPCILASRIWKDVYLNRNIPSEIDNSNDVELLKIDKIAYDNENEIILADDNAPKKYVINAIFKSSFKPKEQSKRFSSPKIEKPNISVNNNGICISLCLAQLYDVEIYRSENNNYKLIYDTKENNKNLFVDKNILPYKIYTYKVVPYYYDGQKKYYGTEIVLEKIMSPIKNIGDDWWQEDLID